MVNLVYRDVAVGLEVDNENPLNTRKVTANVRSYLKSAMYAKFQCAPKGKAMMMKFRNENMCLKDMVYFAQAKWTVRVSAQQGNWYGALMGMSNVFK